MNFNKQTLALAVASALFSSAGLAATNIGPGVVAVGTGPSTYASELLSTAPLAAGAAADLAINTTPGVGYASGFFLRVDLSNGATFVATPDPILSTPATATVAGGGAGKSWLVLSFTAGAPFAANLPIGLVLKPSAVAGTPSINAANKSPVVATITTYNGALSTPIGDTIPAGGATVGSANFIVFSPAIVLTYRSPTVVLPANPNPVVADVSASTGPFTQFVNSLTYANLGEITFDASPTPHADNAGAAVTILSAVSSTSLTVAGDFSARGSVKVIAGAAAPNDCTGGIPSTTVTNTSAAFTNANVGGPTIAASDICYLVNGATAIPSSGYTVAVVGTPKVGYAATGGTVTAASIIRNGVELQAPLAQTPAGWTSRIALSNTSSTDRAYTTTVLAEGTDTVTLGAAATGTIPAGKVLVLNVPDIVTITPSDGSARKRATIVINVVGSTATTNDVQGTYQLISPSGAVTNQGMVRPGTN